MLIVPMHGEVVVKAGRIGARADGKIVWAVVHVNVITIPRAKKRKIGCQTLGKDMAPTQSSAAVAITQTHHLLHRELVVAIVERKEESVVFAQRLRHLGIHIVEVDLRLVQVFSKER